MDEMDYTLQDSRVLLKTATKYKATDTTPGIPAEKVTRLQNSLTDAELKDTAQKEAVNDARNLTKAQNEKMAEATDLIRSLRKAEDAAFEDDDARYTAYHMDAHIPVSVKEMTPELKYLRKTADADKAALAKENFGDAQFTAMDALIQDLPETDVEQEDAKKVQKNATAARNDAMEDLKSAASSVRKSADSAFAKKPDVLTEFEKIPRGHGGTGKDDGKDDKNNPKNPGRAGTPPVK